MYIDGLMQEIRNSSALAMELRLSCINPSILAFYMGHRKGSGITEQHYETCVKWTPLLTPFIVIQSDNLNIISTLCANNGNGCQ